jgi:hypothetical protein
MENFTFIYNIISIKYEKIFLHIRVENDASSAPVATNFENATCSAFTVNAVSFYLDVRYISIEYQGLAEVAVCHEDPQYDVRIKHDI